MDVLTPVLAKMKKHFKNKPFMFQQDSAPSHTANKTQEWCKSHFLTFWKKEVWPPSSLALNLVETILRI